MKIIELTHAYLSVFSIQLFPCQQSEQENIDTVSKNWLDWLIPSAYANHGVRFTEPTQIPIKVQVNLMQLAEVNVGSFRIPSGRYCEINYTLAHAGKKVTHPSIKDLGRYSLYISGAIRKANNSEVITASPLFIRGTYASGKNIAASITIPKAHENDKSPLFLDISIDVEKALSFVDVDKPEHFMVRKFFMEIGSVITLRMAEN